MTSVAPGAKDCNWPPWRVSSRLLDALRRLVGAKVHVGTIMLDLFRGSLRLDPEMPVALPNNDGTVQPSAKRSRRRLGYYVPPVDTVQRGDGGSAGLVARLALGRGTKRGRASDAHIASDSKGEVEEAEEKCMEVEEVVPAPGRASVPNPAGRSSVAVLPRGLRGDAGGGLVQREQDDAMVDEGSGSEGEDADESPTLGSLFDRLVCLSLHPMYRSTARNMRTLYFILGDVADQMVGYGTRQVALDDVALRDFVLVRVRLFGGKALGLVVSVCLVVQLLVCLAKPLCVCDPTCVVFGDFVPVELRPIPYPTSVHLSVLLRLHLQLLLL